MLELPRPVATPDHAFEGSCRGVSRSGCAGHQLDKFIRLRSGYVVNPKIRSFSVITTVLFRCPTGYTYLCGGLTITPTEQQRMTTGTTTERERVGRKKSPPASSGESPPNPPVERVEFQVPPGWTADVDAAANALGMSRSAYIRMAVARQMDRDRREREGPGGT